MCAPNFPSAENDMTLFMDKKLSGVKYEADKQAVKWYEFYCKPSQFEHL